MANESTVKSDAGFGGDMEMLRAAEIDGHLDRLLALRAQEVALLSALSTVREEKRVVLRTLHEPPTGSMTPRSRSATPLSAPHASSVPSRSPPSMWVWPGGMRPPAPLTPLLRETLAALSPDQLLSAREVAQRRFGDSQGRDPSITSRVKQSLDRLVEQGWAVRFGKGQYQRCAPNEPEPALACAPTSTRTAPFPMATSALVPSAVEEPP